MAQQNNCPIDIRHLNNPARHPFVPASTYNSKKLKIKTLATFGLWHFLVCDYGILHITVRLQPYSRNIGKRLTKTPKLYFYDTGLACHLLGIQTPSELFNSEHHGSIFENYIISEQIKTHTIFLREPRLYFYRDDSKKEIDLIDASTKPIHALEIKSGETFKTQFTRTVKSSSTTSRRYRNPMRCLWRNR